MKGIAIAVAAALLVVGTVGVASARSVEGSRDIQRYEKAAGSDVPSMPATRLVDWQALDGQTVAVWTANDKPWLVRVAQPCAGLLDAKSLSFTSERSNITAGTDSVKIGDTQCKVESIQAVDYNQVAAVHHPHHMAHRAHKMDTANKMGS